MDVSVVIVDWHQPELTRRAIDSVRSQRVDADVEVVLVVNEADDRTVAAYRTDLPAVVIVAEPTNAGFAGGVARGIAAASAPVVALLNNDAVADHGFLARGLAALAAGGDRVAGVAATVVLEGGFVPVPAAAAPGPDDLVGVDGRRWRRDADGRTLVNGTGVVLDRSGNGRDRDWLRPLQDAPETAPLFGFSGGAVLLRRDALADVGGFDESLFMYYEDLDVSWRLRLAGTRSAMPRTRSSPTVTRRAPAATPRWCGTRACGTAWRSCCGTVRRRWCAGSSCGRSHAPPGTWSAPQVDS